MRQYRVKLGSLPNSSKARSLGPFSFRKMWAAFGDVTIRSGRPSSVRSQNTRQSPMRFPFRVNINRYLRLGIIVAPFGASFVEFRFHGTLDLGSTALGRILGFSLLSRSELGRQSSRRSSRQRAKSVRPQRPSRRRIKQGMRLHGKSRTPIN